MGLAAHLEGVMNGAFLLYGAYMNWVITTFAAAFGTSSLSPITGAAHSAEPWKESIVAIGFPTVDIAIVSCSVLVLWGLRRRALPWYRIPRIAGVLKIGLPLLLGDV